MSEHNNADPSNINRYIRKKWSDDADVINDIRYQDAAFADAVEEHAVLDKQINKLEKDLVQHASREDEIEQMKRRKLQLKDEICQKIEAHKAKSA